MTMIAVRPEDRAQALSPLERKKARKRLVLDQKAIDAVAAESVAMAGKRKVVTGSERQAPPRIPQVTAEKSRQISNRGRKLLIERYSGES